MINKLEKKVRNFAAGIGLAGSLIFPTGCEMTPQGQMFLQNLGQVGAYTFMDEAVRQGMNPQWTPRDNVFIDGNRNVYPMPNRGTINLNNLPPPHVVMNSNGSYNPAPGYEWVNPNDNNDLRVRPLENIIREDDTSILFTYDKYEDKNGDGVQNYPEEYGIKNIFKRGETIHLAGFFIKYQKGDEKRIEIYFPNGENKRSITNVNENSNYVDWEFDKGHEIGHYKSVLYLNDKIVKTHIFEVKE